LKETLVIDDVKDEKYREIGGFHTRSGKIELYSKALEKWGASPLPEFKEPVLPDERYPYLITSNKDLPFFHTALRNIPSLRKISPKPIIQIHPETATACGVQDGDVAVIETETGSIKQSVKINESIDSRVVYADYGWWFAEKGSESLYGWEESNINVITNDRSSVEPLIGTTTQRGMYCNIKKA
jgi:anaerobic selenocysteine-containing dehydrogenase